MSLDISLFLRKHGEEYNLKSSHRSVLQTLSDRIGRNKYTWIKQTELAKECGFKPRNLRYCLEYLQKNNLILVGKDKIDRRQNNYYLNISAINPSKTKEEKCGTVANEVIHNSIISYTEKPDIVQENTGKELPVLLENSGKELPQNSRHIMNIKNHTDKKKTREARRKKDATPIDKNFTPTEEHRQLAIDLNLDIEHELKKFISKKLETGEKSCDWNASFDLWLRRSVDLKISNCGREARYEQHRRDKNTIKNEFGNPSEQCLEYDNRWGSLTETQKQGAYETGKRYIDKIRRNLGRCT